MTFTLRTKPVTFDYTIHGIALDRVSVIRDLGVSTDSKLTFQAPRPQRRQSWEPRVGSAVVFSCCERETISAGTSYHCF